MGSILNPCSQRPVKRRTVEWYWKQRSSSNTETICCYYYLGLPVQHRLAEEAYIFCCCTFIFFDTGTYRWDSAHKALVDTIPTVGSPAELIKYLQTFDICCPPFLQGGKTSEILAQISTPVVFKPPYFLTTALYRKTKTNLSRTDDRSTITPNLGWVGPPNSQNRWRIGYPKK